MFKPLVFETLSAVIADFRSSYSCWTHELVKVLAPRTGGPAVANCLRLLALVCTRLQPAFPLQRCTELVLDQCNE